MCRAEATNYSGGYVGGSVPLCFFQVIIFVFGREGVVVMFLENFCDVGGIGALYDI